MDTLEVRQQMLIRVPAGVVYRAFADPAITTRFWFSHSDGPLTPDATRKWEWRMYGVSTRVRVRDVVPDQRLLIEWDDGSSCVEWTFEARSENATLVTIRNFGFKGSNDQVTAEAIDSMGGFSLVLANAKALLEHGIDLNLIADRAPDALVAGYLPLRYRRPNGPAVPAADGLS